MADMTAALRLMFRANRRLLVLADRVAGAADGHGIGPAMC
jgi:hypothetical protein